MIVLSGGPVWVGSTIRCRSCNKFFVLQDGDDVEFVQPLHNSIEREHFIVNCPNCGEKRSFFPKVEKETVGI